MANVCNLLDSLSAFRNGAYLAGDDEEDGNEDIEAMGADAPSMKEESWQQYYLRVLRSSYLPSPKEKVSLLNNVFAK